MPRNHPLKFQPLLAGFFDLIFGRSWFA